MPDHTDDENEQGVSTRKGPNVRRRDVMKAAGAAGVISGGFSGTTIATETNGSGDCNCEIGTTQCIDKQEGCSYCKIDDPSGTCTIPGTNIEITRTSGDCITYSDPDGVVSEIALKSGSNCPCTNFIVGGASTENSNSQELCTECGQDISHVTIEYNCGVPPQEECEWDLNCTPKTETCEDVVVTLGGTGLASDCAVDATLTFEEEDCPPVVVEDITSPGDVSFNDLQGCCTPDEVVFTPADETGPVLSLCDITPSDAPCGYDDLTTYFGKTPTCEEVKVCVSDVECPITAKLSFKEGSTDCPDLTHEFTADGCYTFKVSGCCTPQEVTFVTEDGTTLTDLTLKISGLQECGYEDVASKLKKACCDDIEVCLTDVECPVTAELVFSDSECSVDDLTFTKDDCLAFDLGELDCCCEPTAVKFYTKSGDELTDLKLDLSGLDCVCDEYVSKKFDVEDPAVGSKWTVDDVTIEITDYSNDPKEKEGCFNWKVVGDGSVLAIGVKGGPGEPNLNLYGNCEEGKIVPSCGATSGTACAPSNPNSGKRYGVSHFTVYVCKDDFGGCLDLSK